MIISALKTVLIETLWNVKYDIGDLWSQDGGGINRNIVECKVCNHFVNFCINFSINRNIVECKDTLYKSVGGVHCTY